MSKPKYLYKYLGTRIDRIKSILIERQLYFSSPVEFNDPFDCATTIKFPDINKYTDNDISCFKRFFRFLADYEGRNQTLNAAKAIADRAIDNETHKDTEWLQESALAIQDEIMEYGKSFGVTCMSEDPTSILMWSHYSESHKGIVLQFEYDKFVNPEGENRCFPIRYRYDFPSLEEYMGAAESKNPTEISKLFYLRKHIDWRYEKEWRLFTSLPNDSLKLPNDILKGIIFGCKSDSRFQEEVKKIISTNLLNLDVYYSSPANDSFYMNIFDDQGAELKHISAQKAQQG